MTFSPSWYTQHPDENKTNVSLDGISLEQIDGIVSKAAMSNQERTAAATSKADYHSFLRANSWYRPTVANNKVVNRLLLSKGLTHPMYAEINEVATEAANAGLLDEVDGAALAQSLDGNGPKKFTGTFTKREYTDLDTMLVQERHEVIQQQGAEKQSDIEQAFDKLPADEAKQVINAALKQHQANADGVISSQNSDSWLSLHPEFRDDEQNAKLLAAQMRKNGVVGRFFTIEDHEIANRQLVAAGLIRQNPKALRKQQDAEVVERAQHALKNSAAFDTTTEEEMEALPLDEVRRRANGNYTGVGY
jgi:hypothetical protein